MKKTCNWNLAPCNQKTKRSKMVEQKTNSLGEKAINKWTESSLVIEFSSPEGQQENIQCARGNTRWNIQSIGSTDFCYGVGQYYYVYVSLRAILSFDVFNGINHCLYGHCALRFSSLEADSQAVCLSSQLASILSQIFVLNRAFRTKYWRSDIKPAYIIAMLSRLY